MDARQNGASASTPGGPGKGVSFGGGHSPSEGASKSAGNTFARATTMKKTYNRCDQLFCVCDGGGLAACPTYHNIDRVCVPHV